MKPLKGGGKTKAAKVAKKVTQKATGLKKQMTRERKRGPGKAEKVAAQKNVLIQKLKEELARKERWVKESLLEFKNKADAKIKEKTEKLAAQKDVLFQKLKNELAEKEKIIRESEKILKETARNAGNEIIGLKKKMDQSILDLKSKAGAEIKKLKEEVEVKGQALRGKVTEIEEYRKAAEGKIFELQAKVKEYAAKLLPGETERTGLVTFKGNPLTLLGPEMKVGDKAPGFQVLDNSLQPKALESFKGQIKIISAVPSLDTPVCNLETRRFNEEAGKLPDQVVILTISMDLPFAQARWCAAAGVEKVKTFSDYKDRSFGLAYGVLIKELNLLARTVFIVDEQDVIRYVEVVPEIAQEPDYEGVLNAVRALL